MCQYMPGRIKDGTLTVELKADELPHLDDTLLKQPDMCVVAATKRLGIANESICQRASYVTSSRQQGPWHAT